MQQRKPRRGNYRNTFCTVQLLAGPGLLDACTALRGQRPSSISCWSLRPGSALQRAGEAHQHGPAGPAGSSRDGECPPHRARTRRELWHPWDGDFVLPQPGEPAVDLKPAPSTAERLGREPQSSAPRSSGATQGLTGTSPTLLSLVRNIAQSQG